MHLTGDIAPKKPGTETEEKPGPPLPPKNKTLSDAVPSKLYGKVCSVRVCVWVRVWVGIRVWVRGRVWGAKVRDGFGVRVVVRFNFMEIQMLIFVRVSVLIKDAQQNKDNGRSSHSHRRNHGD